MIKTLQKEFDQYDVDVLMGGQIGIGIHPKGWDKSYILQFINLTDYESVSFYGDRCLPNGNDYPLYSHMNINGNFVKGGPVETLTLIKSLVSEKKSME